MTSDLILRSGRVTVRLDRDESVLELTCERHVTDQGIPLRWPNAITLMRDFLGRHVACQADSWYEARLFANDHGVPVA